ncbi:hypothetical protein FGO68_gene15506 [Halteria grandinella]|uniref:UBC core domain-containing protein n=1 Tax=Halteria grandinella TaxID=5974 RepID=A0A8J8SYH5_HALGN|nr:hypothetical protein FGO68_gene15506 [Halteria grandinella]
MAANQISVQRLMREKQKMEQELDKNSTFIALPTTNNIYEWHFVLYNFENDSAFHGGQFHGIINIPSDYPLKPPSLKFVTPNGRFNVGEKICLQLLKLYNRSFTNYHPETWSSAWTISSMLIGLVSFMHTNERTVGGVDTNDYQKKLYAQRSIQHNLKNPQFVELFSKHYQKLGINPINEDLEAQQPENQVNLLPPRTPQQNQRAKIIVAALLIFALLLLLIQIFYGF